MKLYNTYTKQKEEFISIEKNKIKMYICGQTVYDYCHLGHARKGLVFDMIRRWFIAENYEVIFVENITDIDDKIINQAIKNNETISELTSRYIKYMHEDFDKLNILRPTIAPLATNYIPQMLSIIKKLVEKGYAYQAENLDVYYSVKNFSNYGKLSNKLLDNLIAGERVDIDQNKKYPMDFVLWKHAKENSETSWPSDFGKGRPGWHIECSAMAHGILGETFDIHGGGQDLIFPHHENEIAQSEACFDKSMANYWLHNGFLNINDEKMSKSLGNFFTLREMLNLYHPEVIRLFVLKTHYRSPLNFNLELLDDAKYNLDRWYLSIQDYNIEIIKNDISWDSLYSKKFKIAMEDDFNTPLAISYLFELVGEINKTKNESLMQELIQLAKILGLLSQEPKNYLQSNTPVSIDIENLIAQRNQARANKNFILGDEIRQNLLAKGIILEDKLGETTWRRT